MAEGDPWRSWKWCHPPIPTSARVASRKESVGEKTKKETGSVLGKAIELPLPWVVVADSAPARVPAPSLVPSPAPSPGPPPPTSSDHPTSRCYFRPHCGQERSPAQKGPWVDRWRRRHPVPVPVPHPFLWLSRAPAQVQVNKGAKREGAMTSPWREGDSLQRGRIRVPWAMGERGRPR
jgi:hypothetical protein